MKETGKIEIKLLSEEELPEVIAIENLSFSSPWKETQFKEQMDQFYCAKLKDKIVGFIGIEQVQDEVRITHMAVHPIYRRQGIGKELIAYGLRLTAKKFILEVRKSNAAAQNLYKSFGFKEVSRRKKYYNDNEEDALVMIYEKKST